MKTLAMIMAVAGLILAGSSVAKAGLPINTGDVQNITNSSTYYEREADLLKASSGTWYLTYAKTRTTYTAGDNKDTYDYDAYVRTSTDSGANWSGETKVLDGSGGVGSFRGPKVFEADEKVWVLGSNLDSDLYANTYSAGSWAGQSMVQDGTYHNGFYHVVDPVVEGDNVRLFGGITCESDGIGFLNYDGSTDTWDTSVTSTGVSGQVPDVVKIGNTYHMVCPKVESPGSQTWSHIIYATATDPTNWTTPVEIATSEDAGEGGWNACDPAILKYGDSDGTDDFVVFWADNLWPSDGSQNLEMLYSTDGGSTWSDSVALTDAYDEGSSWASHDFMPSAHMLDADTIQVLFNMGERGMDLGQGDIVSYDLPVSAVPEPGTMCLLGLGGALAFLRRRRK